MRTPFIAVPVAAAALAAAGLLGSATAQEPTTTPTPARAVVVNGAAQRVLDSGASDDRFRAAYDAALQDAIADAKRKATLVARSGGLQLGALQRVTELSNTTLSGCAYGPVPYAASGDASAVAKTAPAAKPKHKHKPKSKPKARAATSSDAETYPCPVQAAVALTFAVT